MKKRKRLRKYYVTKLDNLLIQQDEFEQIKKRNFQTNSGDYVQSPHSDYRGDVIIFCLRQNNNDLFWADDFLIA